MTARHYIKQKEERRLASIAASNAVEALRKQIQAIDPGRTALIEGVAVQRKTRVYNGGHVNAYYMGDSTVAVNEGEALHTLYLAQKQRLGAGGTTP